MFIDAIYFIDKIQDIIHVGDSETCVGDCGKQTKHGNKIHFPWFVGEEMKMDKNGKTFL